jgi:hypothetical protein
MKYIGQTDKFRNKTFVKTLTTVNLLSILQTTDFIGYHDRFMKVLITNTKYQLTKNIETCHI